MKWRFRSQLALVGTAWLFWSVALASQRIAFGPVWYIDGPLISFISPTDSGNELRVNENGIDLVLRDGQQLSIRADAVTRIRYFRRFEREPRVAGGDGLIPLVGPGAGLFRRSANHYVELLFSRPGDDDSILTLRLDKNVYRAAIERLQQLTSRPIRASVEDVTALSAVKTEPIAGTPPLPNRGPRQPPLSVKNLAVDAEGRTLAAILLDGSVIVWDIATGALRRRWQAIEGGDRDALYGWISFRPETGLLATSSPRTGVRQWQVASGAPSGGPVWADDTKPASWPWAGFPFWFEPDGRRFIFGSDLSCRVAETGSRATCVEPHPRATTSQYVGDENWSSAVHFDPGSGRLLVGTYQAIRRPRLMVSVFDWSNGKSVHRSTLDEGDRDWGLLGFAGADRLIGNESSPKRVRAWDAIGTRLTPQWDVKLPDSIDVFALSAQFIAAAGRSGEILVYSADRGRLEHRLKTSAWITALTFLPGGILAAATVAESVELWDVTTGRAIRALSVSKTPSVTTLHEASSSPLPPASPSKR